MTRLIVVLIVSLLWTNAGLANHHEANSNRGCDRPVVDIVVPDGASSTLDEMLNAQDRVNDLIDEAKRFRDCMEKQMSTLDRERTMASRTRDRGREMAKHEEYQALKAQVDAVTKEVNAISARFKKALSDFNDK